MLRHPSSALTRTPALEIVVLRRSLRVCLWAVSGFAFLFLVAVAYHKNAAIDLAVPWNADKAFLHGDNPYLVPEFVYPPSSLLFFLPLGEMEFGTARVTFFVISAALALISAELCLRLFGMSWRAAVGPVLLLALAFYAPFITTLRLGQVNVPVLAGECGALLAMAQHRWALSGWLLGLTLAIKPVLAPLIILPVLWRRWEAVWRAIALPAVLSAVALLLSTGSGDFFSQTVPSLLSGHHTEVYRLENYNVSLRGACELIGIPSVICTPARLLALALGGYLVWRRLQGRGNETAKLVDCTGIILVATFLGFSFSFNYYGLFLLPLLVSVAFGFSCVGSSSWGFWVGGFLVGSPDVYLWRHTNPLATQIASLRVTLGFLLILGAFVASLWPGRTSAQEPARFRKPELAYR